MTLLAENATGYRNLVQLVSRAFLDGFYYKPRMDLELLSQHAEGLIATSGCLSSTVCRAITDTSHLERLAEADRIAAEWLVRGDERLRIFHGDLEAVKRLVRRLVADSDIHCSCEKSS